MVARHWDLLLADLEQRPATFIIDTAPAGIDRWNRYPLESSPRLHQYVRDHIEPRCRLHRRVRLVRRVGFRPGLASKAGS